MELALIVAAARNRVIGCQNRLPWHLPQDLRYFKRVTLGKPVIMGRKTFESIGRPLPGRTNIVVTRQAAWQAEGVLKASGLVEALEMARNLEGPDGLPPREAMVIGGAEIYRASLPLAQRVYLTRVDAEPEGDAFFDGLDERQWALVSSQPGEADAPLAHAFLVYERSAQ